MTPSPKSQTKQSMQVQPPAQTPEHEIQALRRQVALSSQLLWETVRKLSPETDTATVPAEISNPLWQLAYEASSDGKSIRILAGTIPPITEQEKKRVVRTLRGTSTRIVDAVLALKLPHPPSYVEDQIKAFIVWNPGKDGAAPVWNSVKPASIVETIRGKIGI